jgi:uncharacterized protein with FMN-binding domain
VRNAQRYSTSSDGNGGRIAVAAIATASGLVALFSYNTSPGQNATAGAVPQAAPVANVVAGEEQPAANAEPDGNAQADGAAEPAASPTRQRKAQRNGTGNGAAAGAAKVYLGSAVDTRWGPVQVKITVRGGKIAQVAAPVSPNSTQTSVSINQRALPILNSAAVKAGSAQIDAVSGATVTSEGYVQSLQSAIDQANL